MKNRQRQILSGVGQGAMSGLNNGLQMMMLKRMMNQRGQGGVPQMPPGMGRPQGAPQMPSAPMAQVPTGAQSFDPAGSEAAMDAALSPPQPMSGGGMGMPQGGQQMPNQGLRQRLLGMFGGGRGTPPTGNFGGY